MMQPFILFLFVHRYLIVDMMYFEFKYDLHMATTTFSKKKRIKDLPSQTRTTSYRKLFISGSLFPKWFQLLSPVLSGTTTENPPGNHHILPIIGKRKIIDSKSASLGRGIC